MGSAIEATTHRKTHPVDYFKMAEPWWKLSDAAHAVTDAVMVQIKMLKLPFGHMLLIQQV